MANIIVPARNDWVDTNGNFTLQAFKFFEDLTELANGTSVVVESGASPSTFSAQVQQIRKELNGLPKFTCDTTGFTADSTEWTADKDIA